MNRVPKWTMLAIVAFASGAAAQNFATPENPAGAAAIERSVVASGGGRSANGAIVVRGTVGQADADPLQPSTAGGYALVGGFWGTSGPPPVTDRIFADGFDD